MFRWNNLLTRVFEEAESEFY